MENNLRRQVIRIDVLPDDVLLEIFDFYMALSPEYDKTAIEKTWQTLVHVCRRWRNLVFGSPRRLNLRLVCGSRTPTRNNLDVWPALPLIVQVRGYDEDFLSDPDNVVAALEQSNRICQVDLEDLGGRQLEEVLAAMQVPFPELTVMRLSSSPYETPPVIPDSFLGGSAPRLKFVDFSGIIFPGIPNLLLSATHLVDLRLNDIPYSGYISAEAMIAIISVLSNLETLHLHFRSPESHPIPESRGLPPANRSILPALRRLYFAGVTEYLDELVTCIDAPQLDRMDVYLPTKIGTPRLAQFINRTLLRAGDEACVKLYNGLAMASVKLLHFFISTFVAEPDRQLSSVAQVCNPLHTLSSVERLYIMGKYSSLISMGDANEDILWLQLLLPFTAVKNLYLYKEFAPSIAAALQGLVGRRIIEVLPSLQNIIVEGLGQYEPLQEDFGQFVAARQLSGRPIAISF